jgi:hypothetical protein
MVGTVIITDILSVKWYKPFDIEFIGAVIMGYEKSNIIDWNKFRSDINILL